MGKPTEAVRAAVVHVAFNVLGVLVWLPFIPLLGDMAAAISPEASGLEGGAKLAAEVPRQIANANTLFNVVNTLLFIGFTTWFARLAVRLVPEREVASGVTIQPQFLDEGALRVPSVALENARREIHRTGMIALDMMDSLRDALLEKDRVKVDNANRREDEIDALSSSILQYLDKVRQAMLTSEESATQQTLMKAIGNIESLADLMEKDTIGIVTTFLAGDYQPEQRGNQGDDGGSLARGSQLDRAGG